MKTGVAKINAGIHTRGKFIPLDATDKQAIIEGHEYYVPDNYDFTFPGAIFKEKKGAK